MRIKWSQRGLDGYRPVGIAVLVGWVPSPTGLAMLLQNSLAYLVDVVAADIAQNMGLEPQDITLYGRGSANTVLEHQEVVVAK
jgi:hypothetical protein